MRNKLRISAMFLAGALVLLVGSTPLLAQGRPGPRGPERHGPPPDGGPDGPGFRFLSSEMRSGGKVVKGAPYSAEAITESTQTLTNGTKLVRRATALVYRDSEGRMRREQSASPVGPFATSGDAPRLIFITDPVAGVAWTLWPDSHTARKMALPPEGKNKPPHERPQPPPDRPPFDDDRREPPPFGEARTETLDKQMIEGVQAEGRRVTVTIPVNQIGNDRPLEIISERWYSPELQTTVLSRHSDPRWGETVYKLTKISRSEPDRSLFTVPGDYTIKEEPWGRPPWGGERRRPPE